MKSLTKTMAMATIAASALALSVPAAAQNLIVNGGFEQPDATGPGYVNSPPPPVPGWVTNNVDVVSNSFFGAGFAHGGTQTLDLVGFGSAGSLYQEFATVIGQSYVLNFFYSRNFASTNNGTVVATVQDTGVRSPLLTSGVLTNAGASAGNPNWLQFTGVFTATSALTRLTFTGTGANNGGIVLDDVSISAAPEPATWGMMIVGFGIAGAALRVRRRRPALAA